MNTKAWTGRMFAGAAGLSLIFALNTLTPPAAAQPVETSPPETVQTQPGVETEPPTDPELTALAENTDGRQVFVWDVEQGRMLCCKGEETQRLYPASITKLYTAALAMRYLEPDTRITAGEELGLVRSGSSRACISRGCVLTAEMLTQAMLIPSGNDAAYVLAAAAGRVIAGEENMDGITAVSVFIEEMNRRGQELGFVNSHFVNPDGYHDEDHYTCPADAARMGELALAEETVAKYAAMPSDAVTFVSGERISWYNTNHLINPESPYYSPHALGLKTGYTDAAGQCLLAAFRQGERTVLVGIFGAETQYRRYSDAAALFQKAAQGD